MLTDNRPSLPTLLIGAGTMLAIGLWLGFQHGDWTLIWILLVWLGTTSVVFLGSAGWRRVQDARAHDRWQALKDDVVHTEKVEALGHTQGGLSEAREDRHGALSESKPARDRASVSSTD